MDLRSNHGPVGRGTLLNEDSNLEELYRRLGEAAPDPQNIGRLLDVMRKGNYDVVSGTRRTARIRFSGVSSLRSS